MPDETSARPAWSVAAFAAFWDAPDPGLVAPILTNDVVGHWAGAVNPVRGRIDYVACIAALVEHLPDVRLDVAEHASDGEVTFVRWIMHATGAYGLFELSGIDRVVLRDGRVAENRIVFDTRAFEALSGIAVPWASPIEPALTIETEE